MFLLVNLFVYNNQERFGGGVKKVNVLEEAEISKEEICTV